MKHMDRSRNRSRQRISGNRSEDIFSESPAKINNEGNALMNMSAAQLEALDILAEIIARDLLNRASNKREG